MELVVDPIDGDWPRRSENFPSTAPGDLVGIDLTQQHIEHAIDRERRRLTIPRPQLVRVRIVWKSALGAPDSVEFDRVQL